MKSIKFNPNRIKYGNKFPKQSHTRLYGWFDQLGIKHYGFDIKDISIDDYKDVETRRFQYKGEKKNKIDIRIFSLKDLGFTYEELISKYSNGITNMNFKIIVGEILP